MADWEDKSWFAVSVGHKLELQTQTDTTLIRGADWFELTPMQLALIYEGIGSERPSVNVEQVVVHLDDMPVEIGALQAAWKAVADRHDALRLVLDWRATPPRQRCVDECSPVIALVECSADGGPGRDERIAEFLAADRAAGIELLQAPGWRVALLRFDTGPSVMVWTVHHALVDGRSMARIVGEVLNQLAGGGAVFVHEAARPFREHAVSMARGIAQTDTAAAFFRDYLADFGDAGELKMLPDQGAVTGALRKSSLETRLSPDLRAALEAQAQRCGGTFATVIQVAWGVVLARWGGREDVAFGTVRSGRHDQPGFAATAGCFINTLPLRLRLGPTLTLAAAVQDLRRATLAMHPFEQTSGNAMREACGLNRRQPLFTSVVMFERATLEGLVHRDVSAARPYRIELYEEGGLPLSLSIYGEAEVRIVLEHDPVSVSDRQGGKLLAHLARLLAQMALADPDATIGSLDMLEADEQAGLLRLGQPDTALGPTGDCLVRNFAAVVAATPDAVAVEVVGQDDKLSFGALDAWANGIASALCTAGVGAGDVVAIRLPRSAGFIAGMLAVLKCGAAFVPVDPTYPAGIQAHMLSDSGAKALIGTGEAPGLVVLDPKVQPPQAQAHELPLIDPDQLAYVLYTSGSTGTPKGVQVTRRNLLSHIAAITAAFDLCPEDRVLQFASLSFDVALEEVFPTLMAGATVVLRSPEMAESASAFLEMTDQRRLSVANLPTAFWHVLTDFITRSGASVPPGLRLLIVGGEQPAAPSLRAWCAAAPHVKWMNGYGPTEATITCTLYAAVLPPGDGEIPIGRPTAHARAYVLAPDHSLAPAGAMGVLAIGGAAVARGYVGQPSQTARAFLPDPRAPGGQIYLTGDQAHWDGGGNLSFLGRDDRQVKLRGFRIDLRQIERALEREVPNLRVLAAVLDPGTPIARLVAWIAGTDVPALSVLKSAAARVLPAHMQPFLMIVEGFPRTAGGKLDMAALPRPNADAVQNGPQQSGDALETQIASTMGALLGLNDVGLDQNFYDLGGHSLLLVELIGRLETLAGLRLGLLDVRENPTPRQLAQLLRRGSTAPRHIVPIQPDGNRPPLFAVHILGANEEYFRPIAAYLGMDQPILGVSVGAQDKDTPTGVVFTAGLYCKDINDHFPNGPLSLIAVSLGSYMAFELAQQLRASGRDVRLLAILDAAGPAGRDEVSGWRRILAHLRRARYMGRSYPGQMISNRIYDLRIALAARKLRRAAKNPEIQTPISAAQFDVANELAVTEYTPEEIHVPLAIFRAESHFFDTHEGIQKGLGWASVAGSGFEVIDVPGGHLTLLQEPHVRALALRLRERLGD